MNTFLRKLTGATAMALALGVASTASAGTVTFDSLTATWSLIQGGANLTGPLGNGTGTASVFWGATSGGQSGYEFDAAIPPSINISVPPSPSLDFILGTFTHFNMPISAGTSITGARLTLNAHVLVDDGSGPIDEGYQNFVYDFVHNETPNGDNPCADGNPYGSGVNSNGCADNVSTNYNFLSDSFTIGANTYTLDIRGFELLDTTKVLSFWTAEGVENSAYVLARVALKNDVEYGVPEPATLALIGTGLLGIGLARRRRKS